MTPTTRRESLDGLRGYAALAVAIFHGILHYDVSQVERVLYRPLFSVKGSDLPAKFLLMLFNGESAVIAFFILSGFVLRGALDRMNDQRFIEVVPLFTWRRIARIYPAVVACMAVFFLISLMGFPTFPHFTFTQFWQNATLWSPIMHGPSWSVQVELFAVPFLLAAELLRRLLGPLGLLLALFYGMIAIEYPVLVARLPSLWPYLFMFFIGMLLVERPVADAVRRLHPATWIAAVLVFLVGRHITERKAISGLIAHGLAGGLLVACAAYREDALTRFLTRPFSLFLGRISYSFYLLNVVALYGCWAAIDAWARSPARHALGWGLASGVVSVLLTIPAATLSERFIERPGIAAGRAITKLPGMVKRALFTRAGA